MILADLKRQLFYTCGKDGVLKTWRVKDFKFEKVNEMKVK